MHGLFDSVIWNHLFSTCSFHPSAHSLCSNCE